MRARFLSPVGSSEERLSGKIWPGAWYDATGFGRNTASGYTLGYHEGADLNLAANADKGKPVYPIRRGTVIYARLGPGTWGYLVVIYHGIVDGLPLYTRYAHGTKPFVSVGQEVDEWTVLFLVSNAEGAFSDHLHFSICYTEILATQAWHWPGWNIEWVEGNYFEPHGWLSREHEVTGGDMPDNMVVVAAGGTPLLSELPLAPQTVVVAGERRAVGTVNYRQVTVEGQTGWVRESDLALPAPIVTMYGNAARGANVRSLPTVSATIVATLAYGAPIQVQDAGITADNYHWMKRIDGAGYVAKEVLRATP